MLSSFAREPQKRSPNPTHDTRQIKQIGGSTRLDLYDIFHICIALLARKHSASKKWAGKTIYSGPNWIFPGPATLVTPPPFSFFSFLPLSNSSHYIVNPPPSSGPTSKYTQVIKSKFASIWKKKSTIYFALFIFTRLDLHLLASCHALTQAVRSSSCNPITFTASSVQCF